MSVKFYECKSCNSIFNVVKEGEGTACKEDFKEIVAGSVDAVQEKHVPAVKVDGNLVTVIVGEVEHPMLPEHFIEWIAIETKQGMQIKYLNPGEKPELVFALTDGDEFVAAYEHCNLHGLWKKEA